MIEIVVSQLRKYTIDLFIVFLHVLLFDDLLIVMAETADVDSIWVEMLLDNRNVSDQSLFSRWSQELNHLEK